MDVGQARELKFKLAQEIKDIIYQFEQRVDMMVVDIEINRCQSGDGTSFLIDVELEVKL